MKFFKLVQHSIRIMLLIPLLCLATCQQRQVVTAAAPQKAPESTFKYAYAMSDCAPWDGAAVYILLTDQPFEKEDAKPPFLAIHIYKNLSALNNQTFDLKGDRIGSAGFCPEKDQCKPLISGSVKINSISPEKTVEGEFDLIFEGGIHKKASFRAVWNNRRMLCG